MKHQYKPNGVCSTNIDFEIKNGRVYNVKYQGGCNGNLQGISKLVEGQKIEDVIYKLSGIKCGNKNTSCPDQLAKALENAKIKEKSL